MRKALDKKLGLYINVAALVSLIASVLTIYFFVGALNRNAVQTDTQLLTVGIAAAADQNENWAADYGWWDEAVTILRSGDIGRLSTAMVSSFDDHAGFDFLVLADEASGHVYGWHRETGSKALTHLLSAEQIADVRTDLGLSHQAGEYLSSHYVTLGDHTYIASGTVMGEFADRNDANPQSDPVIIIGTEMDKGFFGQLEHQYLVEDIRFLPAGAEPMAGAVQIIDDGGHHVGQVVWSPSRPGLQTLRLALIPILAYVAAFLVAAQLIGWHAKKLARTAELNERRAMLAARTDSLSGLPNRHGFHAFIESDEAVIAAEIGQAALIYVDLNGFKAVNDKAGHHAGDEVIRQVAKRFTEAVPADTSIARMGGDEFACALVGADQAYNALDIARALSASLSTPIEADGGQFEIGAAIGVSWSLPEAPKPFCDLVEEADLAMYRAKADQLEQPLSFDVSFGLEHSKRRELESDIERGLAAGEFYVHYQPIVEAETGKMVSAEALLRWEHPTRGTVPPDVFIPIAERSKLINSLGDLVLDHICRDFDAGTSHSISINLSPRQLNDPELCARYLHRLSESALGPDQIELELTEAVLIDDFDRASARVSQLTEAGFRINLDDFGTGFAGMGYLKTLPFTKIKIDKSFVRTLGRGEAQNKMLQAMALLGDALDRDLVAEGVENEDQARLLRLLGIRLLQGWHFGRPMSATDLRRRNGPSLRLVSGSG
jgi:diguanylate cyclase (GGDEF)-like protein